MIHSIANKYSAEVQERMPTGCAGRETSHNSGPLSELRRQITAEWEDRIDIEQILQQDNVVFHYTSSDAALNHILPGKKLRLSSLSNTDDPFEYKFHFFSATGTPQGSQETAIDSLGKAQFSLDKIRRKNYQAVSFSSNRNLNKAPKGFMYGYEKSRMWSQYGAKHFGVCLAFNTEKLNKCVSEQYKIHYSDHVQYEYHQYHGEFTLDIHGLSADNIDETCQRHIDSHIGDFFYHKNPDYKDENEYRITISKENTEYCYLDFGDALLSIVVGDRFPDGLLPLIWFYAKYYRIPSRRLHWNNGKPLLLYSAPINDQGFEDWTKVKIQV